MGSLVHGKVKKLISLKGFGFIEDHAGVEYFFHRSAVQHPGFEELKEGQAVEFRADLEGSSKGPRANDVRGL